jgi:hypothetical protein
MREIFALTTLYQQQILHICELRVLRNVTRNETDVTSDLLAELWKTSNRKHIAAADTEIWNFQRFTTAVIGPQHYLDTG